MNYDGMKAADLRALCELRGLKVHRAKVDMIEELKAFDAASDDVLPDSEDEEASVDLEKPESASEPLVWVSEGRLYKRYPKDSVYLGESEHQENLTDILIEAVNHGLASYGPSFRAADMCGTDFWIYAVNVR